MAAAKNHTKKGRKTKRSSFLCSFGGCFGISNKVSADHGDRKSISGRQERAAFPVNVQFTPAPPPEIVSSSKEIHVVEDDVDEEKRNPSADEILSNKTRDRTSEKSKNGVELSSPSTNCSTKRSEKQKSSAHDTWTNHRKLSHSVSLPLPHQKKAAAAAGEFDSTVGAVMISVTLVVMMIWGKVCAVLCTAAWFYFVPRLRAKIDESYAIKFKNGESNGVDFDSWEYKKKVVLQGLLHRNQNL